jgi:hypothetical protein
VERRIPGSSAVMQLIGLDNVAIGALAASRRSLQPGFRAHA